MSNLYSDNFCIQYHTSSYSQCSHEACPGLCVVGPPDLTEEAAESSARVRVSYKRTASPTAHKPQFPSRLTP